MEKSARHESKITEDYLEIILEDPLTSNETKSQITENNLSLKDIQALTQQLEQTKLEFARRLYLFREKLERIFEENNIPEILLEGLKHAKTFEDILFLDDHLNILVEKKSDLKN